jgi:hypothetical protein
VGLASMDVLSPLIVLGEGGRIPGGSFGLVYISGVWI